MSALGWKVGDPDVIADQLALDLESAIDGPEDYGEPADDLSWDEWFRSLPRSP